MGVATEAIVPLRRADEGSRAGRCGLTRGLGQMQPGSPGPSLSLAQTGTPSAAAIPLTAPGFPAPLTALLLSPDLCLPGASQGSPVCWAPSRPWEAATGALPLPGREHRV